MSKCIDCTHCVPDSKYSSGYGCDSRGFRTCITNDNLYEDDPCPWFIPRQEKPQPKEDKPLNIIERIGTPADECMKAFNEENADVLVCLDLLIKSGLIHNESIDSEMVLKERRWQDRLDEVKE